MVPTSAATRTTFTFISHSGLDTQILAYTLDSLVRVSRRVNENHFVMISNKHILALASTTDLNAQNFVLYT
jgi:hypothetical protein